MMITHQTVETATRMKKQLNQAYLTQKVVGSAKGNTKMSLPIQYRLPVINRHTLGMKELYSQRKETIERIFGTAKEKQGLRYTQMFGKARMEMKVGLTFACMNMKKLAKMKAKWVSREERTTGNSPFSNEIR